MLLKTTTTEKYEARGQVHQGMRHCALQCNRDAHAVRIVIGFDLVATPTPRFQLSAEGQPKERYSKFLKKFYNNSSHTSDLNLFTEAANGVLGRSSRSRIERVRAPRLGLPAAAARPDTH